MTTPAPSLSGAAVDAVRDAVEHTKAQLFPFRFERWLTLGFVAFLDQCGRGAGGVQLPGPGGSSETSAGGGRGPDLDQIRAWLGEHVLLIVLVAAVILALVVAIVVLVTWLRSRGTFVYIDNVAKGTAEVARPWREHGGIASSYFVWQLGIALLSLIAALILVVALLGSIFYLVATKDLLGVLGIVVTAGLLLILALVSGLIGVASRDFVAPLQYEAKQPFGSALKVFWSVLSRQPLAFIIYVLMKILFGLVAALLAILACCLTCCCALLPVVHQTVLQPVYYFERAWSLFFLRRLGHDVFARTA